MDTPDRILFSRLPDSPYGEDATRIVAGKISEDAFAFLFKQVFPFRGANDRVIALLMHAFIEELVRKGHTAWSVELELQFHDLVRNPNKLHLTWNDK